MNQRILDFIEEYQNLADLIGKNNWDEISNISESWMLDFNRWLATECDFKMLSQEDIECLEDIVKINQRMVSNIKMQKNSLSEEQLKYNKNKQALGIYKGQK